ncbi:hypothetical protein ENUP19_0082G0053 [Entamoeba nuttalli]
MSRLKRSPAYHDFNKTNQEESVNEQTLTENSFFLFADRIPSPHMRSDGSPTLETDEKIEQSIEEFGNEEKPISTPLHQEQECNCYTDTTTSVFEFSF